MMMRTDEEEAKPCRRPREGEVHHLGSPKMFQALGKALGTPMTSISEVQAGQVEALRLNQAPFPLVPRPHFSSPDSNFLLDMTSPVGREECIYSCKKSYKGLNICMHLIMYVTNCLY